MMRGISDSRLEWIDKGWERDDLGVEVWGGRG